MAILPFFYCVDYVISRLSDIDFWEPEPCSNLRIIATNVTWRHQLQRQLFRQLGQSFRDQ